ncbi:MAG: hypothetical protein E6J55_19425 [Deltaproteobacteria bacterium]|nr:MAG: hypothetical protein E6J55_19425 [Deltaproteobacteria bacterium]
MSSRRAGRTSTIVTLPERAIPQGAPPARKGFHAGRRRAALASLGHRPSDPTGFDGDVCVRYEAVYRRAEPACGERRLLLAVLEDGIRTFLKNAHATHGRAGNLKREALTWLSSDQRDDVFDFENICEMLGIDAGRLRARVLSEAGLPATLPAAG